MVGSNLGNLNRELGNFVVSAYREGVRRHRPEDVKISEINFREYVSEHGFEITLGGIAYFGRLFEEKGHLYCALEAHYPDAAYINGRISDFILKVSPSNNDLDGTHLSDRRISLSGRRLEVICKVKKMPLHSRDLYADILGRILRPTALGIRNYLQTQN